MINDFSNKNYWAIILGGSSGLGLASALKLARHGINICIVHRDFKSEMGLIQKNFEEFDEYNIKFISFNADVSNPQKRSIIISGLKENIGQGKIRCLIHSISKGNLKPMVGAKGELQNEDFIITLQHMAFNLYDWVKDIVNNNLFAKDARVISFTRSSGIGWSRVN